ncbi:hypothetical protein BESB_023560 [Besnoitia besnoiti]|uniref:Uncharacterized protein n=1 Tax=Besnoitia besnoiti TaxID=94643 RepID=A0A2A9M3S0_BESBE|nr:hypothetical protein BESB_023560 [Besnoitia besnoiti]PFH31864.1 hypothetical protein BESB_023560 [Besnoitia besnoiti]
MSKLSAFFEKKKKKSLKTSMPAGLGEKPRKSEEEPASLLMADEGDASEWAVEEQQTKVQASPEEGTAAWLKVSVVEARAVRKEPEKTWHAILSAGGEGDRAVSEAEGTAAEGAAEGEKGGEEGEAPAAAGQEDKTESPAAASKKWVPPSLRGRRTPGSGAGFSGAQINFDDDQDLATVAQLGLYNTKAGASKKKPSPQTPQQNVAKKEKEKNPESEDKVVRELPPVPEFNVWNYVKLEGGKLEGCKAPQNDEAVRQKYLNRKRFAQRAA